MERELLLPATRRHQVGEAGSAAPAWELGPYMSYNNGLFALHSTPFETLLYDTQMTLQYLKDDTYTADEEALRSG